MPNFISQGNSALHYALSHGNLSVVSALLEVGEMEVDQFNHAGFTPSMLAAIANLKTKSEEQVLDTLFKVSRVKANLFFDHSITRVRLFLLEDYCSIPVG